MAWPDSFQAKDVYTIYTNGIMKCFNFLDGRYETYLSIIQEERLHESVQTLYVRETE